MELRTTPCFCISSTATKSGIDVLERLSVRNESACDVDGNTDTTLERAHPALSVWTSEIESATYFHAVTSRLSVCSCGLDPGTFL